MSKKQKPKKVSAKNLSAIDKAIYNMAYVLYLILWCGFFLLSFSVQRYIIFNNENVLAYSISYWQLFSIIPLVLLCVIPLYFIKEKYEDGVPLFKKSEKNIKSKNKRKIINLSPEKKAIRSG